MNENDTNERSRGSGDPLSAVAARLTHDGHDADADALIAVDHLMREYAFTRDELSTEAVELGEQLRAVVSTWFASRGSHLVDICDRLRRAPAKMIGTADEDTYWACHDAIDLITKLRDLVSRCNIECGNLHHQKGEYHKGTDRCPVLEKFRDVIGQTDQ